jgi:hypothetical protein
MEIARPGLEAQEYKLFGVKARPVNLSTIHSENL